MASTFSKQLLSGSTNGKAIKVAATATAGTTIHTAVSGTSNLDEIWLYAVNSSASSVKLTLEWGEASAPDGNIELTVLAESGLVLVCAGLLLQNSLVVKAFAGTANVILLHGYVNRITVQVFVPRPHAPRTRVSTYLSDWMPLGDEPYQFRSGYIGGGNSTAIYKNTFSSDTATTLSATLTSNVSALAGFVNSGVAGYFVGGNDGARVTTIDKLTFPLDTKTTLGTGLSAANFRLGAWSNNGVACYAVGGDTSAGIVGTVDKFAMPAETRTTGTSLTTARREAGSFSNNAVAGYIAAGQSGSYLNSIEKQTFPSDTATAVTATTTNAVEGLSAFSNSGVAGYMMGGGDTGSTYYATVDKLTYSTETKSTLGTGLIGVRLNLSGYADVGVAGYALGGQNQANTYQTTVDKFAFPSDTRSVGTALPATKSSLAGAFADCGVF